VAVVCLSAAGLAGVVTSGFWSVLAQREEEGGMMCSSARFLVLFGASLSWFPPAVYVSHDSSGGVSGLGNGRVATRSGACYEKRGIRKAACATGASASLNTFAPLMKTCAEENKRKRK